jgi:predicted HicB family RNase H-like nuclease
MLEALQTMVEGYIGVYEEYPGFTGRVYNGYVYNTHDVITFHASERELLHDAFVESIKFHQERCHSKGLKMSPPNELTFSDILEYNKRAVDIEQEILQHTNIIELQYTNIFDVITDDPIESHLMKTIADFQLQLRQYRETREKLKG